MNHDHCDDTAKGDQESCGRTLHISWNLIVQYSNPG